MTKHSQRTRVWTESEEMRIFTQQRIRPTFIYLESDNLAPDLTGDQCTAEIGIKNYLFIAVREGNEERRVSRYPVSGDQPLTWGQMPSLLTDRAGHNTALALPRPVTSRDPYL